MKKFLSLLLVVAMLLSMTVTAFATNDYAPTPEDPSNSAAVTAWKTFNGNIDKVTEQMRNQYGMPANYFDLENLPFFVVKFDLRNVESSKLPSSGYYSYVVVETDSDSAITGNVGSYGTVPGGNTAWMPLNELNSSTYIANQYKTCTISTSKDNPAKINLGGSQPQTDLYSGEPATYTFGFALTSAISKDTQVTVKLLTIDDDEEDFTKATLLDSYTYTFTAPKVAKIGDVEYTSLAAAIEAVPTNGTETTITMLEDVNLEQGVVIPFGKNVVLELNGKKIGGVTTSAGNTQLIYNKGILTIQDNTDINKNGTGTGLITNEAKSPDTTPIPSYASNTIFNRGTLTVKSGKIESTTSSGAATYAVDNQTQWYDSMATVTFNLEGGCISRPSGVAIRMCCGCGAYKLNNESIVNNVNISGGVISAGQPLWIQLSGAADQYGNLTISGGTFESLDGTAIDDAKYDSSTWKNINYSITGGIFKGAAVFSDKTVFISGGTFDNEFTASWGWVFIDGSGKVCDYVYSGGSYIAGEAYTDGWEDKDYWESNGYTLTYNSNYNLYEVTYSGSLDESYIKSGYTTIPSEVITTGGYVDVVPNYVAKIGEKKYTSLKDALADATDGTEEEPVVIQLLGDIVLTESVNINKNYVTIDGKKSDTENYTISADPNYAGFDQYEVGGTNQGYGKYNLLTVSGDNVTVKNLTVDVGAYRGMSCLTTKGGTNVTYDHITYKGRGSGHYYGYGDGTIKFSNCEFNTQGYGIHCAREGSNPTPSGDVVIEKCTVRGWSSFGDLNSVTATDSYFGNAWDGDGAVAKNGNLAVFRPYCPTTLTRCTFSEEYTKGNTDGYVYVGLGTGAAVTVVLNECTVEGGKDIYKIVNYDDAFDNEAAANGSMFIFDAKGDATNGYTAGIFVTKAATTGITLAPKYKLATVTTNVYQVVPFIKVAIPVGQNFVYDENAKTGLKANDAYTLTGTASATNVGKYTATATLGEGYQWADGTTAEKQITWEILKQSQSAPAKGEGYTISTQGVITAKEGYSLKTEGDNYFICKAETATQFASPYTAIDTTVSVNVLASPANMGTVTGGGTYTIGASVTVTATAGSGYKFVKWMDKDTQVSSDNEYTFTATTGKTLIAVFEPADKTVVQIPVAENKTYTGASLVGVAGGTGYTLSGTYSATNAGTYTATATLDNSETSVWADGTTAPKTITWVIYKASQTAPTGVVGGENSITGVTSGMEYMALGGSTYTAINGNSISGLVAGTYYVRKAADTNHLASPAVVVTVSLPTITVTTIQPEVTGQNTAKLYGSVTPYDADRITNVGFSYKAADADGWSSVAGSAAGASFNGSLTNLAAGTKYIAQAYVTTSEGTIYGAETVFYTLAAEPTGEIDVFLDKDANREITLTIEKGNAAIASVTLVENTWKFNELADGFYNIVVRTTDGDFTETRLVEVTGGKVVASSFSIPTGKIATVVEVKTAETPDVAVDGLAEILTETEKNEAAAGSVDVEVKLEVEAKEVETEEIETKAAVDAIKEVINSGVAIATEETIETVLDLSLIKTTSALDEKGEVASVDIQNIGSENDKVLEIAVPYADATAGAAINVYRVHDGAAEKLMQLSSRPSGSFVDGTYFVGKGYIFIYASDFSTYAISSVGEITEFTVTFDANGGYCNTPSAKTNTSRKLASLPTASRFGYSFNGWYTEKTGGEKISTDTEFTANKTVYAHWTMNYDPTPITPVTPTYTITNADTGNGKLTVNKKTASAGQTVTITVSPDEGYKLDTLTVKDAKGNALTLTKVNDTTYTFTMPSGKVTVSATFTESVDSTVCPQDATCVYAKFTDADTKAWYHDGVHFCVENGYMQGVSATAFDPAGTTTRAMIVTMLWRMEGEPVVNYAMSFKDVKADQWYTEAIRWAQSTGVVEGYSAEAFGPDDPITREQMATILYRYAKYHEIDVANTNTLAGFTDVNKVSSWALDAMKWANAAGLVQGRTTTTLVPEVSITRAEAATMVQRYCEKVCKD